MFEFAGGHWPDVSEAKVGKVTEKPLLDSPKQDLWVAQELTSNTEEANNLLFLRWRYERGDFNDH
jgi:hypothetical protein